MFAISCRRQIAYKSDLGNNRLLFNIKRNSELKSQDNSLLLPHYHFWRLFLSRCSTIHSECCKPLGHCFTLINSASYYRLLTEKVGLKLNIQKTRIMASSSISSVQFSRSVVSDSSRPHEQQHARPPCPSPTPKVHSDSRPSSQWCHPAISSSVVLFSSCPQSLPASESFPMSQLFT